MLYFQLQDRCWFQNTLNETQQYNKGVVNNPPTISLFILNLRASQMKLVKEGSFEVSVLLKYDSFHIILAH